MVLTPSALAYRPACVSMLRDGTCGPERPLLLSWHIPNSHCKLFGTVGDRAILCVCQQKSLLCLHCNITTPNVEVICLWYSETTACHSYISVNDILYCHTSYCIARLERFCWPVCACYKMLCTISIASHHMVVLSLNADFHQQHTIINYTSKPYMAGTPCNIACSQWKCDDEEDFKVGV